MLMMEAQRRKTILTNTQRQKTSLINMKEKNVIDGGMQKEGVIRTLTMTLKELENNSKITIHIYIKEIKKYILEVTKLKKKITFFINLLYNYN